MVAGWVSWWLTEVGVEASAQLAKADSGTMDSGVLLTATPGRRRGPAARRAGDRGRADGQSGAGAGSAPGWPATSPTRPLVDGRRQAPAWPRRARWRSWSWSAGPSSVAAAGGAGRLAGGGQRRRWRRSAWRRGRRPMAGWPWRAVEPAAAGVEPSQPCRADIDVVQDGRVLAELRVDLHDHVVLVVVLVDGRDLRAGRRRRRGCCRSRCWSGPGRAALSWSMVTKLCRPWSCWSVLTSASSGWVFIAVGQLGGPGAQVGQVVGLQRVLVGGVGLAAADAQVLHRVEEQAGAGDAGQLGAQPRHHLRRRCACAGLAASAR